MEMENVRILGRLSHIIAVFVAATLKIGTLKMLYYLYQ